jgi:hypothetical protein
MVFDVPEVLMHSLPAVVFFTREPTKYIEAKEADESVRKDEPFAPL